MFATGAANVELNMHTISLLSGSAVNVSMIPISWEARGEYLHEGTLCFEAHILSPKQGLTLIHRNRIQAEESPRVCLLTVSSFDHR